MSSADIGRQQDAEEIHNLVIPLLLGSKSFLDEIARQAMEPQTRDSDSHGEPDARLVCLVLGLLSVRRTLNQWLALAGDGSCVPSTAGSTATNYTDLLR